MSYYSIGRGLDAYAVGGEVCLCRLQFVVLTAIENTCFLLKILGDLDCALSGVNYDSRHSFNLSFFNLIFEFGFGLENRRRFRSLTLCLYYITFATLWCHIFGIPIFDFLSF